MATVPTDTRSERLQPEGLALRGVLAVAFGVLVLSRPEVGVAAWIGLFSFWALADGVTAGVMAARGRLHAAARRLLIVEALLGVAAGFLALFYPAAAALAVVILFAARAIALGLLQVTFALRLGHALERPWLYGLAGAASLAFGVIIAARPGAGLLALSWLLALAALTVGVLQLAAAFAARRTLSSHAGPLPS